MQSRNFLLDSFDGNSSADEVTLNPIYRSVHLRAEAQHDDPVITLTEIHIDDDDEEFVLHILVCESVFLNLYNKYWCTTRLSIRTCVFY